MTGRLTTILVAALLAGFMAACESDHPVAPTTVVYNEPFGTATIQPVQNLLHAPGAVPTMASDAAFPPAADYIIDLTGGDQTMQFGLGIDLQVGERKQLRAQHGGVDRTNQTTWTSNNTSIADFPDQPGRIRGVSAGTAWITSRWGRYFRTLRVVVGPSGQVSIANLDGVVLEDPSSTPPLDRLYFSQTGRDVDLTLHIRWIRSTHPKCGNGILANVWVGGFVMRERQTYPVSDRQYLDYTGELLCDGVLIDRGSATGVASYAITFIVHEDGTGSFDYCGTC